MKLFRNALAAALALACVFGGAPAAAVNMPVRDATNVIHYVCSQVKSGIDYPCQLMYGQRADRTYGPILTDSLGNTISGAFKLQGADTLTAGTSSTRKLLPTGPTVLYTNSGLVDIYFALGGSTVTATTSSAKLGVGRSIALSSDGVTYVAAITATSTASLDMISGTGNPSISGGGGSGGGGTSDATAANQTSVQAVAGSDATKAIAVQGITGGKAVPISAASLPLPMGAATAAKQPALGTAGSASADVITVQGITSMTALKVDGSAVTQPVSGSLTNISGTISLPTGAATSAIQSSVIGTKAAGAAATNSELVGVVYNTALPTLTNGQQAAAQSDSSGRLIVNCGTGCSGGMQFAEDAAHTSGDLGTMSLGVRKDTATALAGADGDYAPFEVDASGRMHVNVGTSALPTGAATETTQAENHGVIGAATAPTKMAVAGGVYVSSAPTLTTGQSFAARLDSHGSLVVACANTDGTLCADAPSGNGTATGAQRVVIASDNTAFATIPSTATSTNGSTTVTTGGTFQSVLASNASRKGCLIQNPAAATESLFVFFGANASATTANSFSLAAGAAISCNAGGYVLTDNVSVTGATTAHAFVVNSQ